MNGAPGFSCCILQRIRRFEFVANQLFPKPSFRFQIELSITPVRHSCLLPQVICSALDVLLGWRTCHVRYSR